MRSLLLATLAAISIPACTQDITGGGGGGGGSNDTPSCGNGVTDPGETCDDGNTNNGDGCSSTCQTESTTSPRVEVTVDKPTLPAMDLGVKATVTVTFTSMMGFAGDVALTTSAADSANAPITDWTLALDKSTVTVAADGTATATLTISAPGDAAALAGKVKVSAKSGSIAADATVDVTLNPEFLVTYTANAANVCVLPTDGTDASPYKIKVGRTIAVLNGGSTLPFIIHSDGLYGFPHENTGGAGTASGQKYVSSPLTAGSTANKFYCHNGGGSFLQDSGTRNAFIVVP